MGLALDNASTRAWCGPLALLIGAWLALGSAHAADLRVTVNGQGKPASEASF